MIPTRGLHRIRDFDISTGSNELVARGTQLFLLPRGITSKRTFFEGIREALPLDPPVQGDHSWDALSDSLWSGLDGLKQKDIAIIWPGSAEMADARPQDFEIAKSILGDVSDSLADPEPTLGNVKNVVVLLA